MTSSSRCLVCTTRANGCAAAARALDIFAPRTATRALAAFKPAFGRLEIVEAEGRRLRLLLVKNPAGFNAAIGALLETDRRPASSAR